MAAEQERVRVLHTVSSLKTGGIATLLLHNLRSSDPDRFQHSVCCLGERCDFEEEYTQAGFPPIVLGHRPGGSVVRLLHRLLSTIRRTRADIVHTNIELDSLLGPLAGRLAGVRVVSTLHHDKPIVRRRSLAWLDRSLVQPCVDHYIAVSDFTRQIHIERRGLLPDKVSVILSGISTARYLEPTPSDELQRLRKDLGVDGCYPVLLNVGRLHEQKGQRYLITMMRHLLRDWPDARLLIAGDGEEKMALREEIARHGLAQQVQMLGARPDVKQLLEICSVFVMPSQWEAFGLAAVEAMASGRAVVASRVGGLPEVINHGVDGFLVPPGNADALTEVVELLVSSEELRERVGRAAQRTARERFDSTGSVRRLESVYSSLVGG